jgi:hypothetical protein
MIVRAGLPAEDMASFGKLFLCLCTLRISAAQCDTAKTLSKDQAIQELDGYISALANQSAYYHYQSPHINGSQLRIAATQELLKKCATTPCTQSQINDILEAEIQSKYSDTAAEISAPQPPFAPFLVFPLQTTPPTYVAVKPGREDFVDSEYPILTHIDGIPIDEWVDKAADLVSNSDKRITSTLLRLGDLTKRFGNNISTTVELQLKTVNGAAAATKTINLNTTNSGPMPELEVWPRNNCTMDPTTDKKGEFLYYQVQKNRVGYVRVKTMAGGDKGWTKLVKEIETIMQDADDDTDSMVIDLRGVRDGHSLEVLQVLVPYFMTNSDRHDCPVIGGFAVALKSAMDKHDWDSSWARGLYMQPYLEILQQMQNGEKTSIYKFKKNSFNPQSDDESAGTWEAESNIWTPWAFMTIPSSKIPVQPRNNNAPPQWCVLVPRYCALAHQLMRCICCCTGTTTINHWSS